MGDRSSERLEGIRIMVDIYNMKEMEFVAERGDSEVIPLVIFAFCKRKGSLPKISIYFWVFPFSDWEMERNPSKGLR